jgi:hypothetical protein
VLSGTDEQTESTGERNMRFDYGSPHGGYGALLPPIECGLFRK